MVQPATLLQLSRCKGSPPRAAESAARFFVGRLDTTPAFWRQDLRVLRGVWERLWDGSRVMCRVPCLLVSYASCIHPSSQCSAAQTKRRIAARHLHSRTFRPRSS